MLQPVLFVAGGQNVELGFLRVHEDDAMKVPQCWCGIDADPGRLKKAMWMEIMKVFNCKALSAWLSCDVQKTQLSQTKCGTKMGRYRSWTTS